MKLLSLALRNLRRDLVGALLLATAVAAGVGALTFFVGLGRGVKQGLRQLFPEAERVVQVVPPQLRLGGLLEPKLDDAAVARLRALPDVQAAFREMLLRVPASSVYRGRFFGADLNMGIEVSALGVDRGLVAADLPPDEPFAWDGAGALPACVSDRLLALYDTTFAPPRGLPHLTASAVLGFTLPVTVGRSLVGASARGPEESVAARVACVSSRALLAGLTLPLETVRAMNRREGADALDYSSVALIASREDAVPAIEAGVRRMGLEVDDSERRGATLAGRAAALVTYALSGLSFLVTALAALGIGQTLGLSVRARRHEIGLLRALGATPADAAALVLWEAATVGTFGGGLGLAAALLAGRGADWALARWLPDFPGRPETLVALDPGLLAAGLLLSVLAAALGALAPARAAARLDPARTLAGG
ncbi:MAG: FtsX-like permease family protein [Myxococcales bacterium]